MAKPKLPYERVAEAAFALHARGEKIVQRAVRAISGGDPAAVGEHLKQWKREHPDLAEAQRTATPELPAPFLRLLQDEIQRRIAEACAGLEGQLVTAQENIEDLTRQVGELQEENSSFESKRDELSAENERLQGQVQQQASDLTRLQQQLEESQRAAEAARVDLAQARLRADGEAKRADQLYTEFTRLGAVYEAEKEKRIDAEKSLASANASLEQIRKYLDQMLQLHHEVEADRDEVQKSLDAERVERSKVEKQLATSQAESKAAKERAEDLQRRETELHVALKEARDEMREQRGPQTRGGGK
jgi:colicin import membrane protein